MLLTEPNRSVGVFGAGGKIVAVSVGSGVGSVTVGVSVAVGTEAGLSVGRGADGTLCVWQAVSNKIRVERIREIVGFIQKEIILRSDENCAFLYPCGYDARRNS